MQQPSSGYPRQPQPGYQPPWGYQQQPPAAYPPPGYYQQPAPRRRHRVFWWVFLAIQVLFLAIVIFAIADKHPAVASDVAKSCDNGHWRGLFSSHADCVKHFAVGLHDAQNLGAGIATGLVITVWVVVDFLVGITYGVYRLATRR
jgi:uncharacterized membrane protein YhaH (DUF805 family)